MDDLYEIVRFYQSDRKARVQKRNLTLEQAQAWCADPETSSVTASKPKGCQSDDKQIKRWHEQQKHWFDGFRMQV